MTTTARALLAWWLLFALPAQAAEPTSYTLMVAPPELNTIMKALGQEPFDGVNLLMTHITQQVLQQRALANMPAPKPPPQSPKRLGLDK